MNAIESFGLTKTFAGRLAVANLSLVVPMGQVYGFLGPNGAGKTTAMRMLLGLIRPDAGSVSLLGHDLTRSRLAALGSVGSFIESASVYDHLSGRDNLALTCRVRGFPSREIDRVLEIVDLADAGRRIAGTYSLGMRQRLALARALLGSPRLLLLDEPTNGLDPEGIASMRSLIRSLPDRIGGTVFMSSHLLTEVEHVASVVGLMRNGSLIMEKGVRDLIDGSTLLCFESDDPHACRSIVEGMGLRVVSCSSRSIKVRHRQDDCIDGIAAVVNRRLNEAGVMVSKVAVERSSLEDMYHQVLSHRAEGTSA